MLIKQSQDDGGDEVTWKVSPVNERLKVLSGNQLPGPMKSFTEGTGMRPCSGKQGVGKTEKWLSSPTDRCVVSSSKVCLMEVESGRGSSGIINGSGMKELGSPFRTPPSTSYGPNELVCEVACTGALDQSGRQHRKALLELLDQVEDAISEELISSNPMLCDGHDATRENMSVDNVPTIASGAHITPKRVCGAPRDVLFLVLEVSEKHRTADSSCTQSPYKVLRLLDEQSGQERTLHLYDECKL